MSYDSQIELVLVWLIKDDGQENGDLEWDQNWDYDKDWVWKGSRLGLWQELGWGLEWDKDCDRERGQDWKLY